MQINKISAEILQDDEDRLVQELDEKRKSLSFLIELTAEERRTIPKASRRLLDFTETAFFQAQTHPTYLPQYMPFVEFEKDMKLKKSLRRVYEALNAFTKRVKDTILVVDSEAYQAARVFYKTAQTAAKEGSEDAERIVKDMAYHFRKAQPEEILVDNLPEAAATAVQQTNR
ncbi:MAG: hypothetical protein MUF15_19015 [Acidobacteria bacterium]|jgi:hypothetical protein|nr:hypothetical protein [Acidobacteriota bacterium]